MPTSTSSLLPTSPPPPLSHRVLSHFYPHLQSLYSIISSSSTPPTHQNSLIREKDSDRFKQFLQETWIGSTTIKEDGIPQIQVLKRDEHTIGMTEILHQVLQRIFVVHSTSYHQARKHGRRAFTTPKNVLACGYRLVTFHKNDNNTKVSIGTGPTYENVFTNTIASSLTSSKEWSILLSRIGPDSTIKLLSSPHLALFQPLQNGCFVQISGEPVSELTSSTNSITIGTDAKQEKKKGRKVHCRSKKKRSRGGGGKKKEVSLEEQEMGEVVTTREEEGEEGGEIESRNPTTTLNKDYTSTNDPLLVPPTLQITSPAEKQRTLPPLGPSKSAPSLSLFTPCSWLAQQQSIQITQTRTQNTQIVSTPSSNQAGTTTSTQRGGNVVSPMKRSASLLDLPTSTMPRSGLSLKVSSTQTKDVNSRPSKRKKFEEETHSNNTIVFSRHRLYHARLPKTKEGRTIYGLSQKHILSRLPTLFTLPPTASLPPSNLPPSESSTLFAPARHFAKYIFPRQFRSLGNVFQGEKENVWIEVRRDFEDREREIKKLGPTRTPGRLKSTLPLLNRFAVLHSRCNYRKLLDIKCPRKMVHRKLDRDEKNVVLDLTSEPRTQNSRSNMSLSLDDLRSSTTTTSHPSSSLRPTTTTKMTSRIEPEGGTQARLRLEGKPKLAEYACSNYEVESYVQAVVRDVVPRAFWGNDANTKLIMKHISQFSRMRRFETISLHSLLQGFSLLACDWLAPPSSGSSKKKNEDQKINAIELEVRKELMSEFLYWFFDSFITDLVRTAFYVTDSATHQNRPLYFRQDDWTALTAPLLESLGHTVFERVPDRELIALERQKRELGFSYVRLLPKETGVRPIVNLARRPLQIGLNGQIEVGQPINQILRSVFDVLNFEKKRKPHLVGSLVSNPQEIFSKLKVHKTRLQQSTTNDQLPKLYFVKVDVKSCFDTIKQAKLLEIVEEILSETLYYIQKYSQVIAYAGKTARQFKRQACGEDDLGSFKQLAMQLAEDLHDVVLSDQVRYDDVNREKLLSLLKEHITTNLVKVGGRLFRQRDGIPQGSILSSLLCALFYGDMENSRLAFTQDDHSLLMRYVDDFLFVTTNRELAVKFLRIMSNGIPEYGCEISPEKRLTNFDISLEDGEVVPPLADGQAFPYCGLAIDTQTLEIKMNLQLQMNKEIVNQLTVQRFRKPGEAFLNAMLRAVKVRSHSMYTDTTYNSIETVFANVYQSMLVVALKFQSYIQEWCGRLKGRVMFFWRAIGKIVRYEFTAVDYQARKSKLPSRLERSHILWLGYHAFQRVLSRCPSTFSPLLQLLKREIASKRVPTAVRRVVAMESNSFVDEIFAKRKMK